MFTGSTVAATNMTTNARIGITSMGMVHSSLRCGQLA
jgi:hypothetical protein